MPCMTRRCTNLLNAPQMRPIPVHRPPRHHQRAPKGGSPQQSPASGTCDTPRPPVSHTGDHQATPSPITPAQDHAYTDVDASNLSGPPRQTPRGPRACSPHADHHQRTRPPARSPPRQAAGGSPGLVPPTSKRDRAHCQGPPGPRQPKAKPPRGHCGPHALEGSPAHARPAHLDPPE